MLFALFLLQTRPVLFLHRGQALPQLLLLLLQQHSLALFPLRLRPQLPFLLQPRGPIHRQLAAQGLCHPLLLFSLLQQPLLFRLHLLQLFSQLLGLALLLSHPLLQCASLRLQPCHRAPQPLLLLLQRHELLLRRLHCLTLPMQLPVAFGQLPLRARLFLRQRISRLHPLSLALRQLQNQRGKGQH